MTLDLDFLARGIVPSAYVLYHQLMVLNAMILAASPAWNQLSRNEVSKPLNLVS